MQTEPNQPGAAPVPINAPETAPSAPPSAQTPSGVVPNPFDTRPLHDAFRAPMQPEEVSGAQVNAEARARAGYCLEVLSLALNGLQNLQKGITVSPGDPLTGGLQSCLGACLHTIEREQAAVRVYLQTAPPVPKE